MNELLIKIIFGIVYGALIGLVSVPLSKRLIASRSEDPGDTIALRKPSARLLTSIAGVVSSVGLLLTVESQEELIRDLVLLLPMLCIAIVDSLIRKIPNSLLLSVIITQAVYVLYTCITSNSKNVLIASALGFAFGFIAFTIPLWLKVPVGAGDVKYSAVIGLTLYIGCYLQTMILVGVLALSAYAVLKLTKRGGMKTLIPMGPFLSASAVISMCFPLLGSLVAVENMF